MLPYKVPSAISVNLDFKFDSFRYYYQYILFQFPSHYHLIYIQNSINPKSYANEYLFLNSIIPIEINF